MTGLQGWKVGRFPTLGVSYNPLIGAHFSLYQGFCKITFWSCRARVGKVPTFQPWGAILTTSHQPYPPVVPIVYLPGY
jgi:hypothetical protein